MRGKVVRRQVFPRYVSRYAEERFILCDSYRYRQVSVSGKIMNGQGNAFYYFHEPVFFFFFFIEE